MTEDELLQKYTERYETYLIPLAEKLENQFKGYLSETKRIDRISARAKSIKRFMAKTKKVDKDGNLKYSDPLNQIQDQVGIRIICFYEKDTEKVREIVSKKLSSIEEIIFEPKGEYEFRYFGTHYIGIIPEDIRDMRIPKIECPIFFEIQIKTLFQHAWAESNHDLAYKPQSSPLTRDQLRRVAFASAQAWGADRIFDELATEIIPDY